MSIIKILPDNVSNRIAAGEVIERPASVLKELIENSLDAGAGKITVSVENAGLRLISVVDNGSGMDGDDALLCLEPHATSKISTAEDINRIYTYGFRGEAMPSIASVSRMRIRTRKKDDFEGAEVIVEGGRFIDSKPVGCAPGTEVNVRDIFFNTPARRKFLRSNSTEERHINEMFTTIALACPAVSFELRLDGKVIYSSPGEQSLPSRIRAFYGKTMEENLIPVEHFKNGISIKGYIAKHGYTKTGRREQKVFVNSRPVDAIAAYHGIKEAYGTLTPDGRYPPVLLFIEIDPGRVDVNVHPAKREVRFRESRVVETEITDAIRNALRDSQTPSVFVDKNIPLRSILSGANINYVPGRPVPSSFAGFEDISTVPDALKAENSVLKTEEKDFEASNRENLSDDIEKKIGIPESEIESPNLNMQILAFLDETYILASSQEGLIILDQHAAHERVLFEKIVGAKKKQKTSQKLLIPVMLELSPAEIIFLEKNKTVFVVLGFEFEFFGQNSVMVNALPSALPQENISGLFSDMLSELLENGRSGNKINEAEIARAACSHAMKSHDRISMEEANALIRQLSQCELPFSCPHGRPTIINISYRELEKRFGRRK